MRGGLAISLLVVLSLAPDNAMARARIVSSDEARELVLNAVPLKVRQLTRFGLDQYSDRDFPRLYFFVAMWAGAPNGSAVIGHFAVDSLTGDVWSATTECDEKSTPALRRLQAKIRLRIGLSDAEYHKVKTKGPLCQ